MILFRRHNEAAVWGDRGLDLLEACGEARAGGGGWQVREAKRRSWPGSSRAPRCVTKRCPCSSRFVRPRCQGYTNRCRVNAPGPFVYTPPYPRPPPLPKGKKKGMNEKGACTCTVRILRRLTSSSFPRPTFSGIGRMASQPPSTASTRRRGPGFIGSSNRLGRGGTNDHEI